MNHENVEKVLAALRQHHGRLTVATAKDEGIDRKTLKRAADAGVIGHPSRGNYTDLTAPPKRLLYQGVHLAQDGILMGLGAIYYWGLDGVDELKLQWSVPHTTKVQIEGVFRRRNHIRLEFVEREGVVVTSVRQTLLDAGMVTSRDVVERAYESALRKGLADDREMREFLACHGGWQGAPTLRAVQKLREPGERPTGSDPETLAMQLFRRHGWRTQRQLPVYDHDGQLIGYGDLGFPPRAFIAEINSREFHDLEQRQYEYNRQHRMEDMGFRIRKFTVEDVRYRGNYVIQTTRRGLAVARRLPQTRHKLIVPSSKSA